MEEKNLSTEELASEITRLRLERELRKLKKEDELIQKLGKFKEQAKALPSRTFTLKNLAILTKTSLIFLGVCITAGALIFFFSQLHTYIDRYLDVQAEQRNEQRINEHISTYEKTASLAVKHAEKTCKERHSEQQRQQYSVCLYDERNKYLKKNGL